MKIKPKEFEEVVMDIIYKLDADRFAEIGAELVGGECWFNATEMVYVFTPNESYCDAFGKAEE